LRRGAARSQATRLGPCLSMETIIAEANVSLASTRQASCCAISPEAAALARCADCKARLRVRKSTGPRKPRRRWRGVPWSGRCGSYLRLDRRQIDLLSLKISSSLRSRDSIWLPGDALRAGLARANLIPIIASLRSVAASKRRPGETHPIR